MITTDLNQRWRRVSVAWPRLYNAWRCLRGKAVMYRVKVEHGYLAFPSQDLNVQECEFHKVTEAP